MPRIAQRPEVINLDVKCGPCTTINGEFLWDATWIGRFGLFLTISKTEKLTEKDAQEEMKERLKILQESVLAAGQVQGLTVEQEKLLRENIMLKQKNEELT